MPAISTMNRVPPGPVGLPTESGSGLLIDTLQLVEPKRPKTIPNHILETKIYSNIAQNSIVQARPPVLHFGGFDLYKKHSLSLSIVNVSTDVIRMHIIPPQTKYFSIKYTKSERLVPGLTIECTVDFIPNEWRYYYDCIRINCPGEENLLIPLHAYPVMNTQDFPKNFNFAPVPVGKSSTKVFPLKCDAPVDFEFQLTYVQSHPAFSIEPMSGIIPASDSVEISVTFCPVEFHTACMKVQLAISQFNAEPFVCTFIGNSTPGLLKEMTESKYPTSLETPEILDPRSLTPLDRARSKRSSKKSREKESTQLEIEYKGIRFPSNLESPFAVAQVLNQEPGKMKAKDLREVVVTKTNTKPPSATRQMKEAMFEHKVRQNVYEERQNQLRWQVKLGEDQITGTERAIVLTERENAHDEYKEFEAYASAVMKHRVTSWEFQPAFF